MRDRRLILDRVDLKSRGLQGAYSGLTARSGPFDHNIDLLHPMILHLFCNLLGSHLGSKWC